MPVSTRQEIEVDLIESGGYAKRGEQGRTQKRDLNENASEGFGRATTKSF